MPTLLRVDSSPMFQASVSRRLTEEFVRRWEAIHPGGKLIARDLTKTELAPVTAQWVAAAYTPEEGRSPEQRQLLAVSDNLIAELEAADEYVILADHSSLNGRRDGRRGAGSQGTGIHLGRARSGPPDVA